MRKLLNEELGRKTTEEFKNSLRIPLVLVLDNVRSLNNVGSVFRTADAFSICAIYLCGITGTPPHREIQKTALGATESVDWKHFETTALAVQELKNQGYKIYAVEQAEQSIYLNKFYPGKEDPIALIFGNEVSGVEQEIVNICESCIEIPQSGTKHSLNIAVSAGIICWDIFQKLSAE